MNPFLGSSPRKANMDYKFSTREGTSLPAEIFSRDHILLIKAKNHLRAEVAMLYEQATGLVLVQWPTPIFSWNLAISALKQFFVLMDRLGSLLKISGGREIPSLVLNVRLRFTNSNWGGGVYSTSCEFI